MPEGHSFWEHWKRGATGLVVIGAILIAALFTAVLVSGVGFFVVEIFVSREEGESLEAKYMKLCCIILALIFAPAMFSQTAEKMDLIPPWPPKPRS
jgi:hypothetical protein